MAFIFFVFQNGRTAIKSVIYPTKSKAFRSLCVAIAFVSAILLFRRKFDIECKSIFKLFLGYYREVFPRYRYFIYQSHLLRIKTPKNGTYRKVGTTDYFLIVETKEAKAIQRKIVDGHLEDVVDLNLVEFDASDVKKDTQFIRNPNQSWQHEDTQEIFHEFVCQNYFPE